VSDPVWTDGTDLFANLKIAPPATQGTSCSTSFLITTKSNRFPQNNLNSPLHPPSNHSINSHLHQHKRSDSQPRLVNSSNHSLLRPPSRLLPRSPHLPAVIPAPSQAQLPLRKLFPYILALQRRHIRKRSRVTPMRKTQTQTNTPNTMHKHSRRRRGRPALVLRRAASQARAPSAQTTWAPSMAVATESATAIPTPS
jgi:hypothetical protein